MMDEGRTVLDVAVVGGGPAGISACLELAKLKDAKVALFESEAEIGGIPRSCHIYFGLRDQKRIYTGPMYARRLAKLIRKTPIKINTSSTVISFDPGGEGNLHTLKVSAPEGLENYRSRLVLLTTGCYESSRERRRIPGSRPAGIFTTGALQNAMNLQKERVGKKAVIIGSEHVALSGAITLKNGGVAIAGLVEEDVELQTYAVLAKAMSVLYGFPIYKNTLVKRILGARRVEGVELLSKKDGSVWQLDCDTVVVTGRFIADSALLYKTAIEMDPVTLGPVVDTNYMTSVPLVFAAGNALRGANMHDLCALEGKHAAQNMAKILQPGFREGNELIRIRGEYPVRYVVPQKIDLKSVKSSKSSWFRAGCDLQLSRTVKKSAVEAWSGDQKIWTRSFRRIVGNTRVPLPLENFQWDQVSRNKDIVVRVRKN